MNITIVGTGYVGLVTGTCLAETGNRVWCVDKDKVKIANLRAGKLPIYEPGLEELVVKNYNEGRLHFVDDLKEAMAEALFCFITVGTPPGLDGAADLTQVYDVARKIGQFMHQYLIIVDKSTVPVGTASMVQKIIAEELEARGELGLEFDVVANPEFLKEGDAVADFMRPDRVIIGSDSIRATENMRHLYQPFVRNEHPILVMDIKSAEITKYAANAMLATRISFMNEIAQLCDKVGADILSVRQGIGTDRRIGMHFLYAGAGYGGSCFPKDVQELINTGRKNCLDMKIANAVEQVNYHQKHYLADMAMHFFGEDLTGKKFAVWGLSFKPQTDDIREAPAVVIIKSLVEHGANIAAYDPIARIQAGEALSEYAGHIEFTDNMQSALDNADALMIVTEWRQFRQPDFTVIKKLLRQPVVFDGRNLFDPRMMALLGFKYFCIGRGYYV